MEIAMNDIIEPECGEMVYSYIERVKAIAIKRNMPVTTNHNGTKISVYPDSSMSDIIEKFDLQRKLDYLYKGIK